MENNRSGLPPMTWNTSATSLNISNLKPCSSYTIGVSSINMFLQPGEPSTALYTTSSIASVPSISVDYSCTNAIATVSWEAVSGARSYRAVATGNNGTSLSCTTTGTSCQITTLRCGERYAVRISSIADCESTSNISYVFETAPCPPQNPTIFRECFSNVIIFSWAPTNKTAYYIAQSVDSDGVVNECVTIDTSCYFIQTDCGLTYSFTVSSVYSGAQGCNTGSTLPVTISTAPCLPQNVRTVAMDCLSDTLMTMWNPARGALRYTVQARGNRDDFYNCTSRGTNCTMTGVNCGQSLSVWITASNNECMTDFMLVDVAETVPCAPQDISLVDTCGSFSITLRWLTSNNAIFYTAKTISADGTIRFCNTMNTECEITGLQCGQTYEAFVMSTNFICNSTDSQHIAVKTAPCTPVNVQAVKDCQSNTATVQWQGQQSGGSYTALLVDNEGGMLNCSTSRNNCSIPSLRCGHTYNITVMQNNTHCNSLPSATIQMESVPCAPKQVVGIVNCSSGSMTVGWNSSAVGVNYTTVVWSGTGGPLYCNSKEPHCSVGQLDCGKAYNVMVLAASGSCQSAPSQQITVEQVPCVPTNVSVSRVCGATSVGITWAPSTGAHTYIAIAIDTHGQRSQCVSNRTSCSIANLTCGQMYSVGVIAANDNCSSQLSQTVSLYTDPCGPTSVSGLVNCSSSTASLLWTPSPNALGYIGRLESYGDVRTCNVSTVGCQISGLLCGQRYSFSVFATDGSCASAQTAPIQLDTAPCAPQNVSTVLACDTNSVTVSWSPSAVPQNYIASAVWSGGTALFCSSQNTSCSMQGLQCGQQYNITVAASNGNCSGPASPVQSIQTAPCIPQNVNGRVACGSSSLVASWDAAPGANGYIATLSASGKFPQMCVTGNLSCVFSGLQCASRYSLSVTSQNGICNNTNSSVTTLSTGPCDPQNVTAILQCSSSIATVMWSASTGASKYTVLAQTDGEQTLAASCSTSSTSCQLTSLTCGKTFNITVLAGDATCNSTSQSRAVVVTAPCLPTILSTSLDCATNAALLSWTPVRNAIRYIVNATSTNGLMSSCISPNFNCSLTGLQCGQTYSVYATARGEQCDSSPSTSVTVITAPCSPSMVNAYYDCRNNTALIGWNNNNASTLFVALLEGDGYSDTCSTTGTNCSITGLRCGRAYNVTVKAVSSNCNSSYSQPTGIQTVPCATQNVSASWQCSNSSAVVVWAPTAGVSLYSVTALGRDGDVKQCNSTTSTCQLSQMHCGQIYNITVTPYTNNCSGVRSTAVSFSTGPCAPSNLSVVLQCQGNQGIASWLPAVWADSYVATATALDGHTHTCASNTTSCSFTELHCGETYSVTVVTLISGCPSDPSVAVAIRTVPCATQNVSASWQCSNSSAVVVWAPTAGVSLYSVTALGRDGDVKQCNSTTSTCQLSQMHCGQIYNITVTPYTNNCSGVRSAAVSFSTGPCAPSNLSVVLQCQGNQGIASWLAAVRADSYVATATALDGHTHTCASNTTSCSFTELHCGETYSVTVVTLISGCPSDPSVAIAIRTVPCATQNVSASWQCSNSSAVVVWAPTAGVSLYSVTALGRDGDVKQCNSTTSTCQLSQMHCGQIYNITVTPYTNNCSGVRSTAVSFSTGPCAPSNLSVVLQCQGNQGIASWLPAVWADSYVATATALDGHTHTCASNTTSCSFTELHCGETYSVTVVTLISGCPSDPSVAVAIRTVPCVPVNVSASVDCSTNTGNISWGSATGAVVYNTKLVAGNGRVAFCSTSGTSCVVMLECGQNYSAVVVASTDVCNSSQSSSLQFRSAPCAPTGLNVTATCNSNTTSVAWNPSSGIVAYYVASAEPSSGLTLTCNSSSTSCDISGLICGQTYNVSVTAYGGDCVGRKSLTYTLKTAPCAPQTVQFQLLTCQSGNLSVVWQPTSGALMYRAEAVTFPGHLLSCYSAYTSCIIPALGCGQTYDISVVAVGDSCNSSSSAIRQASTAPCPPSSVTAVVNCSTNTPTVSWNASSVPGAVYTARAVTNAASSSGMECNSTNSSCALTGLHCSTQYNVTVIATKDNCMSAPSAVYSFFTAPCMPDSSSVSVQVDCATDTALLSWAFSAGVDNYTAVVLGSGGHFNSCSTQQNQCNVSLLCGQSYNLTLISINQQCQIPTVINTTFQSRPCEPVGIAVNMTCGTSSAVVSWRRAQGVDYYIAHAVRGGDGHEDMCISNSSSCLFSSLACGQNYTFTVTAYMGHCSSNTSQPAYISTAPCVPSGLVSASGCGSAGAVLSWNSSAGADVYVVNGWSRDGHTVSLRTSLSTISLPDLHCSQEYNLIVTAINQQCNSTPSLPVRLQTGPCSAATVSAVLDCMSSVAVVSWQPNNGTAIYTATLLDSSGPLRSCVGVGSQCNISGLACGKNYSISVTVSNDQCNSTTTLPTSLQSVPCVPVNISVITVCVNSSAVVVWDRSQGAISYYVNAVSSNGNVSCQSTSPTCTLTNLTCGSTYYVHVVAVGNNCSSMPSQPMVISSVPCKPTNVSVDVQCANDIAVLSWAAQTGAVQYFATAQSDSATPLYCQTTNTSCTLQGLPCGAVYNFTVQASNGDCNSSYSKTLTGGGVPCPPASFRVVPSVLVGQGQLLRAYWSIVNCPNSHYLLEVSGSIQGDPHSLFQMTSYSTNRTYFETPVPCSSTYNTSVRAQNSGGTSVPSAIVTGISVPCPPLSVTFTGSNSSAVVAWNASLYATEYHVYQVTSNGQIQVCNTSQLSCPVTNVSSNLIMVTARNAAGEGAGTSDVRVIAARRRRDLTQTEMGELTSPQASFTMVTADAVWLEWTHVEGADFYSLLIREQSRSSKPVVMTVYGEASIIPELKPATMYCVSLSARNSYSSAPYSEPACVETAALS
uniref:Fibronectin type-III domain-containing protein n=1 Tax=Pygocentrus nattereri TaxID=42514 RepID=A0AAR2JQD7_PYGNA